MLRFLFDRGLLLRVFAPGSGECRCARGRGADGAGGDPGLGGRDARVPGLLGSRLGRGRGLSSSDRGLWRGLGLLSDLGSRGLGLSGGGCGGRRWGAVRLPLRATLLILGPLSVLAGLAPFRQRSLALALGPFPLLGPCGTAFLPLATAATAGGLLRRLLACPALLLLQPVALIPLLLALGALSLLLLLDPLAALVANALSTLAPALGLSGRRICGWGCRRRRLGWRRRCGRRRLGWRRRGGRHRRRRLGAAGVRAATAGMEEAASTAANRRGEPPARLHVAPPSPLRRRGDRA